MVNFVLVEYMLIQVDFVLVKEKWDGKDISKSNGKIYTHDELEKFYFTKGN
jgi:hypothetical protein